MLTAQDLSLLYDIAQAAIEGCNWPSLHERLLEVASEQDIDRVWMELAQIAGRTPERLMED